MPAVPVARLTYEQVAGYAKGAGFTGDQIAIITAIAFAESGGRPNAHNPVPPDDSYGLLQVNMIGTMGPARRKTFGLKSNSDLYDPATNFRVGYALSSGGKNFRAWSTFTSGAYLGNLARARKAAGNPDTSGGAAGTGVIPASSIIPGMDSISSFFDFITDPITWMRLGMIVAGGVLVMMALSMMAGQAANVKQAAGAVAGMLPQTRGIAAAAKAAA